MSKRELEIIVWGATGFTGRLVCEHIAESYQGKLKWAMAGRNRQKLEELRLRLTGIDPACQDVPVITADLNDAATMQQLASRATVVLSAAGPFAAIGTPLVDACVAAGTHYCDTTGEALWVRRMITKHHAAAAAKGVKIVHCCAYDSIPADLGTLLVVRHIRDTLCRRTAKVESVVGPSSGGASGGTLASAMGMAHEPAAEQAASRDPYYLCGLAAGAGRAGADGPDKWGVAWNQTHGSWMQPFLLQFTDRRIVHRSNALLGNAYGERFVFEECMEAANWLAAWLNALGTAVVMWLMLCRPLHGLLKRLLPVPGEGPPVERLKRGFWGHTLIGYPESEADKPPPPPVLAHVGDTGRDCGYWGTARMLLEAGLCLLNEAGSGEPLPGTCGGGVLTPASACGLALIERLRAAGMDFEVCGGEETDF